MYMLEIDEKLAYPNRTLHAWGGKLLFAPVGERLFCDCLNKEPGFTGNIDFIHKMNMDMLFTVTCSTKPDFISAQTMWYPSRLTMEFEDEDISFREVKMITNNDIAFAAQTWENHSPEPVTLQLVVKPTLCDVEKTAYGYWMQMSEERKTIVVGAAIAWDASETDSLTLQPGETVSFTVAAATGNLSSDKDGRTCIEARLKAFFDKKLLPEQYVDENAKEFETFFTELPTFDSSDAVLNKTWYYRWYILRHCTSKPQYGYLQHATVYEGRGHKTGKASPLNVSGWEFSRLICLSSPLQLTDYKWCPDKELLHEIVRGFFENEDEDGIVQSAFVHHRGSPFCNYMIWAVYQMYLVDGDIDFVKEMIPAMRKCVDGNTRVYGSPNDNLQIEVKHSRTGKEFQPSYWYFTEYSINRKDKSLVTPLKRMDTSVYHYLNALGLAKMMAAAGDADAVIYQEFADTLAKQLNEKTWDEETHFYYDLHHETDEKAMVKNIVGFYPYWAEITDESKLAGLDYLFDKEYFNTGSVFATTSKDAAPGYAANGSWMGYLRSRDGCMWNGPSWPYTNGIMLEMLGKQTKANEHKFDKQFAHFLREYSLQHYKSKNIEEPYLVEQYHGVTGEPMSDEPDYNHSFYLELLIGHVAGLRIEADKCVIDPVEIGLKYFSLDNVNVRGRKLSIRYSDKDRPQKGLKKGFVVTLDGEEVVNQPEKSRVEIKL